jgi:site-specific DNA-methyltransferase (adenine-specific)
MEQKEFHKVANVFPLIQGDEFEQLKADIKQNGLLEPIWLHSDGSIIDGRNRYRACIELGIEPEFKTWNGEGSLTGFVVSLNLHRRHLTASQRAMVALEILPMLEDEAKERQLATLKQNVTDVAKMPERSENGRSRDHAANIVNVGSRYISDAKVIQQKAPEIAHMVKAGAMNIPNAKALAKEEPEERAEIIQLMKDEDIDTVKKAKTVLKKQKKQIAKATIPANLPSTKYKISTRGIEQMYDFVEAESVDHIITDPPYPKQFLYLYGELAKFAAYALKPGGSLLAMAGQSYLPDIFPLMVPHINYQWTISYLTPGGQSVQLWDRKVNTFWKPVLWFVKGDYSGDWIGDVAKSNPNDNDKRFHEWGQSESGIADLVERFTYPGDLICDPFLGGGTTAVVSVAMNRLFVGCDIDDNACQETIMRLLNV